MKHLAIEYVLQRAELAKLDADHTYFTALLYAGEALAKTVVAGMVACIGDDKERHRYRLEHKLVHASGLGEWGAVVEDALIGPASQYLLADAQNEMRDLTSSHRPGDWQYDATAQLKAALTHLAIASEDLPTKSDLKRWFRLFATLRNKTRAHGADRPETLVEAAKHLCDSIKIIYSNFRLFNRPWAHLHRNISGKFRVSPVAGDCSEFDFLRTSTDRNFSNGIYIFIGAPRRVQLMHTEADLRDFFFANGGFTAKKFEMLSYSSGERWEGDSTLYLKPPGSLPASETEGHGELIPQGKCLSNAPEQSSDYVDRPALEAELLNLLLDDKRPVVTLRGGGGIGKTSLALKVLQSVYETDRFYTVVWLSARDVDLQLSGPKPVRPKVLSIEDMSKFYAQLVLSGTTTASKDFSARKFFEEQMQNSEVGPSLFVFDNFETADNPVEMFAWVDTFIRLPNKALITTRRREFKGDYPVEVLGMQDAEARQLVEQTARSLGVTNLLTKEYIDRLISYSEGHPYIIKILLGEVAKANRAVDIPRVFAATDEILTALFERTYAAISPCSQRAFLTLSAWNSVVPRIALEAVLYASTTERQEVEKGIEALLQFSLAEIHNAPTDNEEFIGVPQVAATFGKKKLKVSPSKAVVEADVQLLQMFGPSTRTDIHLGVARKAEMFLSSISKRMDEGASYESFAPIVDAICASYPPGWLLLARWETEKRTTEGYENAKRALLRFLETGSPKPEECANAWEDYAQVCYYLSDRLGEIHALIEAASAVDLPFHKLANAAHKLNNFFAEDLGMEIDKQQRKDLAGRLFAVLEARRSEARVDDLGQMAWLALRIGRESDARDLVEKGLAKSPGHTHLQKLGARLGMVA
jgi:hypothetical protein